MPNRPAQYYSHKRQKSSISSVGYYFQDNNGPSQPSPSNQQQQQQQQPYETDAYTLNYNFPQKDSEAPSSVNNDNENDPDDVTTASQSIHNSPLKRSASNDGDMPSHIPSSIPLASSSALPITTSASSASSNAPPPSFFHYPSQFHNVYGGPMDMHPSSIAGSNVGGPTSMYPPSSFNNPTLALIPSSSSFAHSQHPPLVPSSSTPNFQSNLEGSVYSPSFTFPKIPEHSSMNINHQKASIPLSKHQKNNLSISSHFNLFNLNEEKKRSQHMQHIAQYQTQNQQPSLVQPQGQLIQQQQQQQQTTDTTNDLLINLMSVDGSNINSYLLTILYKLNTPIPLDDFYNILYNTDKINSLLSIHSQNKIDKTFVQAKNDSSVETINQLLNVFKKPDLLNEYFPNFNNKDNKLSNINYHELLRTFLAIKILFDILIQMPLNSNEEPQNYTIPRLSVYKTYYIICQKLIMIYPSSSNTTNEQQKLILGQSKLGKLIKLVYPNLLIKRLGSRGESKYNYLGVIWNENIINEEIQDLCEKCELIDLNDIFRGERKERIASSTPRKGHKKSLSRSKIKLDPKFGSRDNYQSGQVGLENTANTATSNVGTIITGGSGSTTVPNPTRGSTSGSAGTLSELPDPISSPNLSFIKPFLKYPSDDHFTILNDEENWFNDIRIKVYSNQPQISRSLIDQVFLSNDNLLNNSSLLTNLTNLIIMPLVSDSTVSSTIDLNLYLIIIIEILPYLLLIKSSTDINFLKNLRLNLLHMINNLNIELKKVNSPKFNINNSTIFLILLKKLINLNDLLITFIKLIIKDNSKSIMSTDIENFLKVNQSQGSGVGSGVTAAGTSGAAEGALPGGEAATGAIKLEESQDDDFFLNLNSNLTSSSLNELNFSFKNDILSNDLIYTLIGYNFDPIVSDELKSSISMNFINQEINIIDEFFKKDLLAFLNESDHRRSSSSVSAASIGSLQTGDTQDDDDKPADSLLSSKELNKLYSLIRLIDKRLLSTHFKSKYPILIYNNFINFILNDILKFIFLKQQQSQLQSQGSEGEAEGNQNSFGNWWVFNSFIQEYLSLMGEIVGLENLL